MANLYVIGFGLMLANGMVLLACGQVTSGVDNSSTSAPVSTTTSESVPCAPLGSVPSVSNSTMVVSWSTPSCPNGNATGYFVCYEPVYNSSAKICVENAKNATRTLTSLLPFTNYSISVYGYNSVGNGNAWTSVNATLESTPCAPSGSVSTPTSNSTVVSWSELSCPNGILVGYFVCYEPLEKNVPKMCRESKLTNLTLSPLQPFTNYSISVFGYTSVGNGSAWTTVITTAEATPCAPNGSVANVTSTSVLVSWSAPSCPYGILKGYFICCEPVVKSGIQMCSNVSKTATTHMLGSLLPFTNYSISLFGYTSVGNGSAWTSFSKTSESTPCAPNGSVANVTSSSMVVSWSALTCPNGILMGYFICYDALDKITTHVCFNVLNSTTTLVLSSLQPFTHYNISAFGYTSAGNGSAWTSFTKTSESTPCAPNGSVANVTSSSMVVSWSTLSCPNGILMGYFICYKPVDKTSTQVCYNILNSTTTFVLSSLQPFTNYNLSLFGYTSVGNGSAWTSFTKTSESTPCAPNGSVANVTSRSMVVSWLAPSCPNGILMGYFICYKPEDKTSTQVCYNILNRTATFVLGSLQPFTNYNVSLFGYTSVGNGSAWTSFNKTSESTPCSPSGLVTEVTSDSMVVSWSAPSCPNGILLGYFVCYVSIGKSLDIVCFNQASNVTNRKLSFLLPFTEYNVSVFGFTSVGNGSAGTIVSKTLESTPCAPSGSVAVLSSTSMAVSWSAPSCPNGVLLGYFVCYEPVDKNTSQTCFKDSKSATNLTLTGLQPFTAYNVSVFGYTSVGNGSAWSIVNTTYESMPCPPYDLVAAVTNDSVVVSWSAPSCPNGILLGYFVCYESIGKSLERVCFNQASNVTNQKLSFLLPFTDYNVSVFGFTSVGNGSAGTIVSKTLESNPCVPNNISATGVTSTGMTILWRTPSCLNGILLGYNVCYRPEKTDTPLCNSVNSTSYVLSQLRPYIMYSISVYAYNSAGRGPAAPWSQQTAAAQPESSLIFKTPVKQPYKLVVNWDPVQSTWGEIMRYEVTCTSPKTSCPQAAYSVNGNQTSLEISGLSRATSYTLRIAACTSAGCGNYTVYEIYTDEDVSLVAGLSVGVTLFALIVIIIVVILLHRRKKWPFATPEDGTHTQFSMTGTRKTRPIRLESLPDRVAEMHADSNLLFHDEYEELKALSPKHSCDAASLQGNTAKNRYVDILPYDHSRVKLLPLADEEGSDYINANYMPGYSSRREFIAAQGPLPGTVDHFWRMIWEQNVSVVVMLTQLIEKGKRKCDQYWPEAINESLIYGDLTVTKVAETSQQLNNTSSDYCVRTLQVSLNEYTRQVTLLCYLSWPDFGCPQTTDTLLNFVAVFRSYMALGAKGPAIVHCSAGVGRTGTFICLDHMLQQIRVKGEVDIFGTVLDMRNARTRMVQTEDQYIYIHDCVRDALLRGMSPFYNPEKSSSLYANDDGSQYINYDPRPRPTSRGFRNSSRASSSEGLVKD